MFDTSQFVLPQILLHYITETCLMYVFPQNSSHADTYWLRANLGREFPKRLFPKGQYSVALSPTCLEDKPPLRKVGKTVNLTSKVATGIKNE